MKKSLLALAVLGTFAGGALAQASSVTLGGIVDVSGRSVKNGSTTLKTMATDGINSSRLYFRGTEDLGGGMSAGFWLEAGLALDTGNAGGSIGIAAPTNGSSNLFNRRSTVSLMGGWGELRLGRDYTPSFWNTTVFDPFGTNGVGGALNVIAPSLNTGAVTYVRANNAVSYFLPSNLGGLYGQLQISAAEGPPNGNKQTSGRIGYAAGPVNVAVSFGTTKPSAAATNQNDYKHNNIAGLYNFGFATLMAQYDQEKAGALKQTNYLLGAVVPMGQGELHVSYINANAEGGTTSANDAKQFALGYVYNLSKRTALYGTYAQIKNDGGAAFAVPGGTALAGGAKSTGYEVGVRHAF